MLIAIVLVCSLAQSEAQCVMEPTSRIVLREHFATPIECLRGAMARAASVEVKPDERVRVACQHDT